MVFKLSVASSMLYILNLIILRVIAKWSLLGRPLAIVQRRSLLAIQYLLVNGWRWMPFAEGRQNPLVNFRRFVNTPQALVTGIRYTY
jgi:hypothetical protein